MLYRVISKYGLATHLAFAAAIPAALTQFVSRDTLAATSLWFSLLAWLWILLEPSVLAGETISVARRRVLGGMLRDPIAWFFFIVVVFALVRWLNSGVAMVYDAENSIWSVRSPALALLPASAGSAGFWPFAAAVAMATCVTGVRHALGRNARIWFGLAAGAVSSTGAIAATICAGVGMEPFVSSALAEIGAASFPGAMFAAFLPVSVLCGIDAEERGMNGARLVFAWAVAGNAAGAYMFLPGMLGMAGLLLAGMVALAAFILLKKRTNAATTARAASLFSFGVLTAVFLVILPPYEKIQAAKSNGLDSKNAFPPALESRNNALHRIAKTMWIDKPWTGVGVGAFGLHVPFLADKDDWSILPPQPKDASNGYFTLIAESGICGAMFWAIGIGMLLHFWISRLAGSVKWYRKQDEGRKWVLCIPMVAWVGPIVGCVCLADAWFSTDLPGTALSICMVVAMSLAAASFPRLKRETAKDE